MEAPRPVKVTLIVPVLKEYPFVWQLLKSVQHSSRCPDRIILFDNGLTMPQPELSWWKDVFGEKLFVHTPTHNVGLANVFNWGIHNFDDYVIFSNSDVQYETECLENLVQAAVETPEEDFFYAASGNKVQPWSLFLQCTRLHETVGLYDTNYYPAYYEDTDYHYRMRLLGKKIIPVHSSYYTHVHCGSNRFTSYKLQQDIIKNCDMNKKYYQDKWGGLPGSEKFTTPFNGGPEITPQHIPL